jgi:hypothetical protein
MQRLAITVGLCLSVAACESGGSPTPTTPTRAPAATSTRIIALEGDLNFGDIVIPTIAEKTIRIVNLGTGTMTVQGFTGPRGGGVCENPAHIDICGSVSVSWPGGDIAVSQWQDVTVRFNTAWGDSVSGTLTVNANATGGTNTLPITARSVSRR